MSSGRRASSWSEYAMKRSTERIRTTHGGSLPRPADLLEMMQAKEQSRGFDQGAYDRRLRSAVDEIVRKQVELGIDIIDDGEYGKPSFVTYMNERLGGFEVDRGPGARRPSVPSCRSAV